VRGLEFPENDSASVLEEAGAAHARVDEFPFAIVLPEDQRAKSA
jgi:hypothetical protein